MWRQISLSPLSPASLVKSGEMFMMMREPRSLESFGGTMYNVVQPILKHATFCSFERHLNTKADPILLGSAAFDLLFALPQELVRAIGSGFKSPLPHQT
jgi:hypothetical protein